MLNARIPFFSENEEEKKNEERIKEIEMNKRITSFVSNPKHIFVWQICMTQYNVILLTSILFNV